MDLKVCRFEPKLESKIGHIVGSSLGFPFYIKDIRLILVWLFKVDTVRTASANNKIDGIDNNKLLIDRKSK